MLLGAAPVLALVHGNLVAWGLPAICTLAGLAGFLVSIAVPNLRAMLLNVNTPEARGVAVAFQSVTDDLGKGLGPVLVAAFISSMGRTSALTLATLGWVPCSLLVVLLGCYIRPDEAAMQASLASRGAAGGLLAGDCGSCWRISMDGSDAAVAGGRHTSDGVVQVRTQVYDRGMTALPVSRPYGCLPAGMDPVSSASTRCCEGTQQHGSSPTRQPHPSASQGLLRHASFQPLVSQLQQSLSWSRQPEGEEEACQPLLELQVVGPANQQHQQQQQEQACDVQRL